MFSDPLLCVRGGKQYYVAFHSEEHTQFKRKVSYNMGYNYGNGERRKLQI